MTRFLLITTLIFLILGIPISAIYWWGHSWASGVWYPGYWDKWIYWVIIASVILVALWIVDFIIWKREWIQDLITPMITRKKKGESNLYRNMGTVANRPLGKEDWRVNEHGQAFHPEDNSQSEPIEFIAPSEYVNSQSSSEHVEDFLTNQRINRLVQEGKITIKEAEATRNQTKNMDFFESSSFLSSIEHRDIDDEANL